MEKNDIIEVDGQEFLVYDSFVHNNQEYFILNLLIDDQMSEESRVVKLVDGLLSSITSEEEQLEIEKILNRMIEELAD